MAATSCDPRIGASLRGYRIERLLGHGETGTVYLAEQVEHRRPAALKIFAPQLAESPGFRARFLEDCELAAGLDHPNVLPIYDAGEADGLLYMAMQFVDGADLGSMLCDGALSAEQTMTIVDQVARGLHAAHCAGLVHRDLKPANILVASGTHGIFVSDFGVAERLPFPRATINYCAPEHIEGKRLDGRADVYSLGCVLFHCLAGGPPFARDADAGAVEAPVQKEPPSISGLRHDLPAALDGVIEVALANDPARRYTTTVELAEACRRALASQPARDSPVQTPVRTAPPIPAHPTGAPPRVRRRRRNAIVAAAVLLLAAGSVAVLAPSLGGGDGRRVRPDTPPPIEPRIAAKLRGTLIPLQRVLTDRIRGASRTPRSLRGIEGAAGAVDLGIGRTLSWTRTSLHPASAADRRLMSALDAALEAHAVYAAYLAGLAPRTRISALQAATTVAYARQAVSAYKRLARAGPGLPMMPLRRDDQLRLVAVVPRAPVRRPASYDRVAHSGGAGIRYRYAPNHWCGSTPGRPVPKTDPCWRDVVAGAGAAEGQRLRIYCFVKGANVRGDAWWAKVRVKPDEYVPVTYLQTGHGGRSSATAACS